MIRAKKAELLLLHPNKVEQHARIHEIMRQVIDTGKEHEVTEDDSWLGDNWYIKMSVYGDYHYLWLSQYDGLIVGMNAMSWEPPWTGFLPGSTTERVTKFSVIWMLNDKELKQEAEFLLKESSE